MATYRKERLNGLIKDEISQMLIRGSIKDPRIQGFITVIDVDCSKDLRHAKVYISILGSEKQKNETLLGLKSAVGFIKNQLSPKLTIRWMPEIHFFLDDSLERGARILQKLNHLEKAEPEDVMPDDDDDDDDTDASNPSKEQQDHETEEYPQ